MPTVLVIQPFKHRGEIVPPGTTLDVPADVLPAMAGYVEPLPRRRPDPPASYEGRLAEEAAARADFCTTHGAMLGGCRQFAVIERLAPGDPAAALDACLLWQLVRAGRKIEQAASAVVLPGLTVGDVLAWISDPRDIAAIRAERRLLLTCVAAMRGSVHKVRP